MRELRESHEVVKTRVAKLRERKTSGHSGLESHFHADTRVRIWPSGSDWLIFLQTRKSIWLVRLIGNTEGTVGISVTALLKVNFASLPGKEFVCKILQFSVYTRPRFPCVWHGLCFWQCLRRNFDFGTRGAFSRDWKSHRTSKESLARSHKWQGCVVRLTANWTWKLNYISVAPWCLQIPVPVRLFIPSSCHNFGFVSSKSPVDSHIHELRNRGISVFSLGSEDKKLMPFYSEVPSPSYKTSKCRNMLRSNV